MEKTGARLRPHRRRRLAIPLQGLPQEEGDFGDVIPAPKKPQKLPEVLSPEEVLHFLNRVGSAKHRAILTTCDAAGLRISEVIEEGHWIRATTAAA